MILGGIVWMSAKSLIDCLDMSTKAFHRILSH
jgi:hypothetical protein